MKKILTAVAAVLMLTAATAAAEESNILINGDCEQNTLGTTSWRFKDSGGWYYESENLTELSDNAYEGEHSLKFTSATMAQRVYLNRNTVYEFSFAVRADEECEINTDFCDGAQDWPANYSLQNKKIKVDTEWKKVTVEFECPNTQDYLVSFNLWDKIGVYIDDAVLKEKDSYISRLMTGVNGNGEVSYSASFVGNGFFGTALYDKDNALVGFNAGLKTGTFEAASGYGDFTLKSYLINENGAQTKTANVSYNKNSAENENNAIGKVKSLELSKHELTLYLDKGEDTLDAFFEPKFAYNNTVTWESSDSSVAEVSQNGTVTPKGEGSAVITAVCGGFSDSCTVKVSAKADLGEIKLDKEKAELREVDSVCVINANRDDVIWKCENEDIAVVNDGVVTAKGAGNTVITAYSADEKYSAKCDINVVVSDNTITNDTFRKDTDGNNIYSQGGGIYKFGDKYYWYGIVYKEADIYANAPENGKAGDAGYEAFSCYSSEDLVNWDFEGYAFDEKCDGWAGRMGVCYNENTKKYVLIAQYAPGTLFAVADKPEGPFKTDHIFTGTVPIENGYTGDQTIFWDEDGKAYMICSSGNGRAYQYVVPLRESDYLDFDYDNVNMLFYDEDGSYVDENGQVQKKDKTGIEGNCMFRYGDSYYFTGSDLYGWNSSRVYYLKSDNILGDYNSDVNLPKIMNGSRDGFAHNSQAGFYVTVKGSEEDLVIYCGDRWADFAGNGIGYNQWVPITIDDDGVPYFNDVHQWKLDAEKGTWTIGEGNNYIKNPEFEADRKTTTDPAGWNTQDNIGGYANSNIAGKRYAGNFIWQQSAPEDYIADLNQELTGLEDGTYTMTAWVRTGGGQNICSLYAQSGGERYEKSIKTASDEWTEVVVSGNIEVKDGVCTVGLYSDAHANEWVQIDDLRFVKNCE